MSFTIRVDELLEALAQAQHPNFEAHKAAIETAATAAVADLAAHIEADFGKAEFDRWGAPRLFVWLYPTLKNQPLPECLAGLDDEAEWLADARADSEFWRRKSAST